MSVFTLPDGRKVRLGRNRTKVKRPVLKFGSYFTAPRTPPPTSLDYASKSPESNSQVYGNDSEGDCVIASKMHMVGVWTANDLGKTQVGTTSEALTQYQTICGRGDNGCVMEDVLDYMKTKGITVGGSKFTIDGYVSVDQSNMLMVQVAVLLFGALDLGFNVPSQWMNNATNGAVWDVPTRLDNIGGHCVPITGYNSTGVKILTWGMEITITWKALANTKIVDTLYAVLAGSWYGKDNMAPNGLNVSALQTDLSKLASGETPDIDPPTPDPTPPPSPPSPPTPPTPPPVQAFVAQVAPVTIHVPVGFRTMSVTIPGQLAPVVPAVASPTPNAININPAVLGDALALLMAIMTKNPIAIATAVQQLLHDLGFLTPQLHAEWTAKCCQVAGCECPSSC